MWDQPTEPTLVGAPVGHPDGSFSISNAIWGGNGAGGNGTASSSNVPPNAARPAIGNTGGKMDNWGIMKPGTGGAGSQQQPWNAGGPSPVKNNASGWDQPSPAANAANNGSSWNASQNAQSSQPMTWNNPGASQWESTSPTGPSSWSQVASKNVPQQQQVPAVRPKVSYDPGTSNWGAAAVDQGTPWGVAGSNPNKANEWTNANGTAGWENNQPKDNSWSSNGQKEKPLVNDGGPGYWKPNGVINDRRPIHNNQQNQWNHEPVASGTGWDSVPPAMNRNWNSESSAPSNVWTGPPSAQENAVDSSMIWNNPNPKKVVQPDRGTNIWGDPTVQTEIRRWKTSGDDVAVVAGGQPQVNAGQQGAAAQTPGSGGGSVWKDSPIAPLNQKMPPGNWNDSTTPSTATNPTDTTMTNGTALWEAASKNNASSTAWGNDNSWAGNKPTSLPLLNKSMSWTGHPPQNAHKNGLVNNSTTPTSHFLNISPSLSQSQNDIGQRTSGNSDTEGITEDVFSPNPSTPTAHLKNGISNNMFTPVGEIQQGNKSMSQPGNQNRILTKQLADRVNFAIQAGFIDPVILNHSLPPDAIVRLNQLLQYISKLEQAQRDYQTLTGMQQQQRQQQPSGPQAQELQRLANDIRQYQTAIQSIKAQINAQASMLNKNRPPNLSTTSSTATTPSQNVDTLANSTGNGESLTTNQSKLMRWKNGNDNGEESDKKSPSAVNLENLVQNVALNGESDLWTKKPNSLGSDWPQQNDISSKTDGGAKIEKSPNENQSFIKDGSNGPNFEDNGQLSDSNGAVESSTKSSTACVTPTNLLDEVPEFRPGQKFNWRDPKEVADDPNATPGSIKANALTLNTNLNLSLPSQGSSNGGSGGNIFGQQPSSASLFGSSSSANITKTNSFDFSRSSIPFNNSDSYLASRAGPGGNNSGRLPSASQLGQPFGGRPPIIKQQYSVPNSFVPYNNMGQWIVLTITNMSQIDEHTLQMLVNRIGTTQSYVSPPGSGVAFVKFRDVPLERVFPRMQQEFTPLGVTIQLMKDSEVERVLQPFNVQRQPPAAMFTGAPNAGAHGGPPHGMMWDAPPPCPWGMPGSAPGMPHHPFMPPTPDQMAQIMPQPPMHDGGLFGGPPDRHPF